MSHEIINGKAVVDWTTGDPEGDRITLLAAYRDFVKEVQACSAFTVYHYGDFVLEKIIKRWHIDTENQIDNVPRTWIKRPEE